MRRMTREITILVTKEAKVRISYSDKEEMIKEIREAKNMIIDGIIPAKEYAEVIDMTTPEDF